MTATLSRAYDQFCSYFRSEPLREPLDKPVEIPEVKMEVVHQYGKIGTKQVSLMRLGDELGYQVTDTSKAETKRVKIPDGANPQPIERRISNYIEKEAIFDPDGKTVHFLSPIFKWHEISNNGSPSFRRWTLLFELKNTLIALYVNDKLGRFQANFRPGFSERTCEEAKACLCNATAATWKIFNLYKLIFVKVFEKLQLPFGQTHDFQLYFEPMSVLSKIDPRIYVSPFLWGVTLVNQGRSTDEFPIENHAQIIIDGLKDDGTYFVRYAHRNKYRVKTNEIDSNSFECIERAPLYKVNREKVIPMIRAIEDEQNGQPARAFTIFGYSFLGFMMTGFSVGHNCHTWACSKLGSYLGIFYHASGWFYTSVRDVALSLNSFKSTTHPSSFTPDPNINKL